MRRVPGEEDPPGAEAVREGCAGPEVRGPPDLGDVLRCQVRARGGDLADAVEGQVHRGPLRELGDQLEVVRAGQRADRQVAVVALAARREHVPVVAVQAGDPHVRDQNRVRVHGLAGHADAERAPDGGATAVGGDDVPGAQLGPGREAHAHAEVVLVEPDDLTPELHPPAQLLQPGEEDLLRPPLRHHPRHGERRVRGRLLQLGRVEHPVLAQPLAVLPDHPDRVGPAVREDRVQDAEVLQDLHGARLDALAARPREQSVRLLHDQRVHTPPGEVDAERQTGRARTHDQDIRHDFRGDMCSAHDPLSLTALSAGLRECP